MNLNQEQPAVEEFPFPNPAPPKAKIMKPSKKNRKPPASQVQSDEGNTQSQCTTESATKSQ